MREKAGFITKQPNKQCSLRVGYKQWSYLETGLCRHGIVIWSPDKKNYNSDSSDYFPKNTIKKRCVLLVKIKKS